MTAERTINKNIMNLTPNLIHLRDRKNKYPWISINIFPEKQQRYFKFFYFTAHPAQYFHLPTSTVIDTARITFQISVVWKMLKPYVTTVLKLEKENNRVEWVWGRGFFLSKCKYRALRAEKHANGRFSTAPVGLRNIASVSGEGKGRCSTSLPLDLLPSTFFIPFSREKWSGHWTTFTYGSYEPRVTSAPHKIFKGDPRGSA